jgi:hypothetical protein
MVSGFTGHRLNLGARSGARLYSHHSAFLRGFLWLNLLIFLLIQAKELNRIIKRLQGRKKIERLT